MYEQLNEAYERRVSERWWKVGQPTWTDASTTTSWMMCPPFRSYLKLYMSDECALGTNQKGEVKVAKKGLTGNAEKSTGDSRRDPTPDFQYNKYSELSILRRISNRKRQKVNLQLSRKNYSPDGQGTYWAGYEEFDFLLVHRTLQSDHDRK